ARRTMHAGQRTLDAGGWTLDAGGWTLGGGRWTLDAGRWTLDAGRWTLDDFWRLPSPVKRSERFFAFASSLKPQASSLKPQTSDFQCIQPTGQVALYIGHTFQPHGDAQQAIGNTGAGAVGFTQAAMRSGGRMGNGGFGVTEVGGDGNHAGGVHHLPGVLAAVLYCKGQHTTKQLLLLLGQFVLRVRWQAAVVHFYHRRMLFQPLRQCQRVGAVGLHTNGDRKSTRLNSSHVKISYAVFCLKKKIH